MDFQIRQNEIYPEGYMVFEKNTDIRTSIYLSMSTKKGSFFQNPDFGSELYKINKINSGTILLGKRYVEDCLKWLITAGRAVSIDVICEADSSDFNRLNIKVNAKQPDGYVISYEIYQRVGGPSPSFSYSFPTY